MAGLQMPKRGDGAAMLRDLRDEERPPLNAEALTEEPALEAPEQPSNGHAPVLTDVHTYGSTDGRTDASAGASAGASKDAGTDGSEDGRKPGRKATRTAGRQEGQPEVPPGILDVVDAALASREPLVGGVKATVDMSPALSTRAKRYLADHRGQNTRQVVVALLDAFLSAKGY